MGGGWWKIVFIRKWINWHPSKMRHRIGFSSLTNPSQKGTVYKFINPGMLVVHLSMSVARPSSITTHSAEFVATLLDYIGQWCCCWTYALGQQSVFILEPFFSGPTWMLRWAELRWWRMPVPDPKYEPRVLEVGLLLENSIFLFHFCSRSSVSANMNYSMIHVSVRLCRWKAS